MNPDSCVMCGSGDLDPLHAPLTTRCRSCGATFSPSPASRGARSNRYASDAFASMTGAAHAAAGGLRHLAEAMKRGEKLDKIRRLRDRAGTEGERAAAQEALDRLGAS